MSLESRIKDLQNALDQSPEHIQNDFNRGVDLGAKQAIKFITTGDAGNAQIGVMEKVEVKTDYSTLEDELSIIVEQFQEDDDNYMEQVQNIFYSFLENLNNHNLIDINFQDNSIEYLQKMNDYKREIIHGMDNIAFFIETVRNIEREKDDLFDSSTFDNAILDITDSYLAVSALYLERAKDKVSLTL